MESAPTNKPSTLARNIIIGVIGAIIALYAYGHFTHKVLNITNKGVSITTATPQVKATPVVVVPVVQKPVVAPKVVAVTPVLAAPQALPVLTPAQAIAVVHAAGPYMNHGCFMHGNSNPSWPYHAGHHR